VNALQKVLKKVMPISNAVSISNQSLNQNRFNPYTVSDCPGICSGVLQLPESSHLLLTFQDLKEGDVSFSNIQSVQRLISEQTLAYDFEFYSIDIPVKMTVLCVYESKSGILDVA
jgi:hypothetical protein